MQWKKNFEVDKVGILGNEFPSTDFIGVLMQVNHSQTEYQNSTESGVAPAPHSTPIPTKR